MFVGVIYSSLVGGMFILVDYCIQGIPIWFHYGENGNPDFQVTGAISIVGIIVGVLFYIWVWERILFGVSKLGEPGKCWRV
jgi:hypothetical protein